MPVEPRGRAAAATAGPRRTARADVARVPPRVGRVRAALSHALREGSEQSPVSRTVPGAALRHRVRAAVSHRRVHRLLHRHPPRHRGGQAVPARQPAAAQLQVGADRLPRPRVVDRRQRAGRAAAAWPVDAARRQGAGVRAGAPARLRARARRAGGRRQRRRHPDDDGAGRGRLVRPGAAQRLVGARHPGLGVPAAGAVPGQELRHHDLAVAGDARGAGAVSQAVCAPGGRSAAAALPRFAGQPRARCDRCLARSLAAHRGDARQGDAAAPAVAVELRRRLLDGGATARAPQQQRLQPRAW